MIVDEAIGNINAATLKTSNEFKNTVEDMMKNSTPVILPTNGRDDELMERKVCVDGKKETMIVLMDSYDDQ